jgi:predicted AlkP superfamily pyrophosphatase or phosphodiesterase
MGAFCKNANVVNMNRIFKDGATSYECSSVYPTSSGECWGSMLMGVSPTVHGLTNRKIIDEENLGDIPTIFRLIHETFQDSHQASFCCWNPINHGVVEDLPDTLREKVGDPAIPMRVREYIGEKGVPNFLFIQFNNIDASGHVNGYDTPNFHRDIEVVDGYIGEVYAAYEAAGVINETLFIVTSDHGGIHTSHGDDSPEEMNVFFGAAGHNVNKVTLSGISIQDIPAIICHALGAKSYEAWESYVPENMFKGD